MGGLVWVGFGWVEVVWVEAEAEERIGDGGMGELGGEGSRGFMVGDCWVPRKDVDGGDTTIHDVMKYPGKLTELVVHGSYLIYT